MLMNLLNLIKSNFGNDERGVTILEYAAIAFLILLVCLVAVELVGTNINSVWESIAAQLPGS